LIQGAGREDELLHAILEYQADLAVLGARRASRRRKLVRRIAMKSPCSVLVVPEDYPARLRRILVAVDFSPLSADALQVAAALARQCGHSSIVGLHVYFESAVVSYEGHEAILRDREFTGFDQFLESIELQGIRVEEMLQESSSVSHAIQSVAAEREIDLVVMGTRGRSASAAVLLGSETERSIQETVVPLLAVKHFGSNLGLLKTLLGREVRQRGIPRFG
jgi:nucleotide-binding universal stress UspA family protein